jgi:cell division protease FtsH
MTTGAQNDLEQATKLARKMVTEYGMSTKLGPRTFGKRDELVFLGKEIHEQRNYSEKVALQIDEEVRELIGNAYIIAREIMSENTGRLKLIADELIAVETIDESRFEELMKQPLPDEAVPSPTT